MAAAGLNRAAVIGVGAFALAQSALYDVPGGHRAGALTPS